MKVYPINWARIAAVALITMTCTAPGFAQEPLPSWNDTAPKKANEPFASLLKGDLKGALAGGEAAIFQIVTVTHSGMTSDETRVPVRREIRCPPT